MVADEADPKICQKSAIICVQHECHFSWRKQMEWNGFGLPQFQETPICLGMENSTPKPAPLCLPSDPPGYKFTTRKKKLYTP